jgi:hypothetical protein
LFHENYPYESIDYEKYPWHNFVDKPTKQPPDCRASEAFARAAKNRSRRKLPAFFLAAYPLAAAYAGVSSSA